MKATKFLAALTLTLFMLFGGAPSFGMTVSGVSFDKQLQSDAQILKLRGAGVLRYMVFIKAYAGALYLPEDISSDKVLEDVPKAIEVEYFHPIAGEDFGPATFKGIAQNTDPQEVARLRKQIDYHNSLYEDVQPGDRYSLTYIPGIGTELALNGEPKGIIEGSEFAQAVFSIWLGPRPINNSFKKQILGR